MFKSSCLFSICILNPYLVTLFSDDLDQQLFLIPHHLGALFLIMFSVYLNSSMKKRLRRRWKRSRIPENKAAFQRQSDKVHSLPDPLPLPLMISAVLYTDDALFMALSIRLRRSCIYIQRSVDMLCAWFTC
ncbi:hypothetical protein J6590_101506 [Homalodisca vitripennis]|nr:hypothetical protein J6590_101506 [Homalodisca vitripennis]